MVYLALLNRATRIASSMYAQAGGGDDAVTVRAAGAAVAPVGERRAEPFAAIEEELLDGAGDRREVRADGVEGGGLLGQELVEDAAYPGAKVGLQPAAIGGCNR